MTISASIFNMFGRSPIRPLQQHMAIAHQTAEKLIPFFTAVLKQDWPLAQNLQQEISGLEDEADAIKRDLRLHLPKGLFLPVPRTDILELIAMQDKIANKAEDISGLIVGRNMQFPDTLANDYIAFLQHCIDASAQALKAINELDELLETGFRGNEVKLVEEMIVKLDEIEHDTDKMQIGIRRSLFNLEKELPPIDAMFLYQVIEYTGELADRAQTVGGLLQRLLAH